MFLKKRRDVAIFYSQIIIIFAFKIVARLLAQRILNKDLHLLSLLLIIIIIYLFMTAHVRKRPG